MNSKYNPPALQTFQRAGLTRTPSENYRDPLTGLKFNGEKYALIQSMKNTQDKNDINNKLAKLTSTPNYFNFDNLDLQPIELELMFKLLEEITNIEFIKLDQIILPFLPGYDYSDMYLSIDKIGFGYKYKSNYYQFNIKAKDPNIYVPANKVVMKPVNKVCILNNTVDNINTLTFRFHDSFFQEINFPKAVIKGKTVPLTNPIQITYTGHGLVNGDIVIIDKTRLCGTYTVTVIDPDTFTIPYDGSLITDPLYPIIKIPKFRILIRINFEQFNGN